MKSVGDKSAKFYGYLEGWLSIFVNSLLFALKYWAGLTTGSIAIVADAWHSLSDSLTSVVVIIGTKISSKPADKEHPFGHGRAELIGSLIIAIILVGVAFKFIMDSIEKLQNREPAAYGIVAIIAMAVSIFAKEGLAQFAIRTGKKVSSPSLIADGWHHRSDSISSIIVLAGIFVGKFFWWIDGFLGIIVSLVLLYVSYDIIKDTVSPLLGEYPGEELIKKIEEISRRVYPDDIMMHHFHLHEYGRHKELTFHIRLPGKMDLDTAHSIANRIESAIGAELGIDTTIHIEPSNGNL